MTAHEAFGRVHRNRANGRFTEVLGDLEHEALALIFGLQRVQDLRQPFLELHVDDGADDLGDASNIVRSHVVLVLELKRFRAGDDLDQFLRDHGLARAIVGDRLFADHVTGVSRRVVHGAHARALLRGGVLKKCPEDLRREATGQELGEDFLLLRLIFVDRLAKTWVPFREHGWDDLLRRRDLRDH